MIVSCAILAFHRGTTLLFFYGGVSFSVSVLRCGVINVFLRIFHHITFRFPPANLSSRMCLFSGHSVAADRKFIHIKLRILFLFFVQPSGIFQLLLDGFLFNFESCPMVLDYNLTVFQMLSPHIVKVGKIIL